MGFDLNKAPFLPSAAVAFAALTTGLAAPGSAGAQPSAAEIDQCMAMAAEALDFTGAALVARRDARLSAAAYGVADTETGRPNRVDTPFHTGSMGKMFAAVAIARLVEAGKLGFDDRVGDHVPDLPEAFGRVTIGQLLSHTAGYGDFFGPGNMAAVRAARSTADFLPLILAQEPDFAPGERFRYSNSGFAMLGIVVEEVSGQSYEDFLRKEIFEPAGMTGVHFEITPDAAIGMTRATPTGERSETPRRSPAMDTYGMAAGGIFSTVGDMHRFMAALLDGRLLKPETVAILHSRHAGEENPRRGRAVNYGYGFILEAEIGAVGHGGGGPGVNGDLRGHPETGWIVAALGNADPPQASLMMRRLDNFVIGEGDLAACGAPAPQRVMMRRPGE
ncbi:MAG: hypothetical protein Tsb0010_08390 [Parvularculaceae bacterium]